MGKFRTDSQVVSDFFPSVFLVQILHHLVTSCLSAASHGGFSSIAFPALGTGQLGYPRDAVAQTMLTAIDTFQRSNPSTSLREVRIVLYPKDKQTIQVNQVYVHV